MSLPEAPPIMHEIAGVRPPSTPEPEVLGSPDQNPDIHAENRRLCTALDELNIRLDHSRIQHRLEAQSRLTLQGGLQSLVNRSLQLVANYKLLQEENSREKDSLRQDIRTLREESRLSEELIKNQKQLIAMYENPSQQQPASHLAQGVPLLTQYNNDPVQYSPCQPPPPSNSYIIDPASEGFDYIGPIEPSCDIGPPISTQFPQFEEQSMHTVPHPMFADRDMPRPSYNEEAKETKKGEDDTARPSKKRKTK